MPKTKIIVTLSAEVDEANSFSIKIEEGIHPASTHQYELRKQSAEKIRSNMLSILNQALLTADGTQKELINILINNIDVTIYNIN